MNYFCILNVPYHWSVSVSGNGQSGDRGIYVRHVISDYKTNLRYLINVRPTFVEEFENSNKSIFEVKCVLKSPDNYVIPAKYSLISSGGNSFVAEIDFSKISNPQAVLTSEILGKFFLLFLL